MPKWLPSLPLSPLKSEKGYKGHDYVSFKPPYSYLKCPPNNTKYKLGVALSFLLEVLKFNHEKALLNTSFNINLIKLQQNC